MNEEIDLGEGHSVRLLVEDGRVWGLIDSHVSSVTGNACGGMIEFAEGEWRLDSLEPLTVMPSINCDQCDSHGIIVEGKWILAHGPAEIATWQTESRQNAALSEQKPPPLP